MDIRRSLTGWKRVMMLAVVLVSVSALLCAGGSQEEEAAETTTSEDMPYAGTTLTFVAQPDVFADPVRSLLPEFQKETGIKVNMETLPYQNLRERQVSEFVSGGSTLDIMTMDIVWMGEFAENGWVEPLDSYMERDKAEIQPDDFLPGAMAGLAKWDGKYYGMPLGAYYYLLFYRTDILADAGLEAPVTLDEFINMVKTVHNPPEMYGFSGGYKRGAPLVHDSVCYMGGIGADVLRDFPNDNTPMMNSKAAVATYKFWKDMLNYAPPGAITFDFTARREVFQQGKVALNGNWSSSGGAFVDPKKSVPILTENLGVTYPPRLNADDDPSVPFGGWSLVINKNSKNKEAAWEFIKWISSPEIQKKYTERGGTPFRFSTLRDKNLQQGRPWFELILKAEAEEWVLPEVRPRFPVWPKMEEIMARRLSEIMVGDRQVEAGLNLLNKELTELLKEEGALD